MEFFALVLGGVIAPAIFGGVALVSALLIALFGSWLARKRQIAAWDLATSLAAPSAMAWAIIMWFVIASLVVIVAFSIFFGVGLVLAPFLAVMLVLTNLFYVVPGALIGGALGAFLGVKQADKQLANNR